MEYYKGNIAKAGTKKSKYDRLTSLRDPYLQRARACSVLSLPTLIAPEGSGGSTVLPTPYQSLAARGVNNLAAKLLITLLPPNAPFFKLMVDDYVLEELTGEEGLRGEVEEAFNSIERSVMTELETTAIRPAVFELLKHLLVGGNVATYMPKEGGMKIFPLDKFVCRRNPMGDLVELITEEFVTIADLPEEMQAQVAGNGATVDTENGEKTIGLYTCVRKEKKKWVVMQEAGGITVPDSEGSYPLEKSPFSVLRFVGISGEDYGRGFVEEYKGDIQSLEYLTKAIVQGSAAAAKVLFLLRPSAVTESTDITQSESGDIIIGNADDISILQLQKSSDFSVAAQTIERLESSLGLAFLMNTSIQRQGERVTAEEIRYMASELENALGGIYSSLSQEFQLPLVTILMGRMESQGKLPKLPKGMVRPQITTGVDAIGRGQDSEKLKGWLEDISVLGPEIITSNVIAADYIKRSGVARGIDMKGLVKAPEDLEAEQAAAQQQQQQQEMMKTLGPNAVTQAGGMLSETFKAGMEGGAPEGAPAPAPEEIAEQLSQQ
jgi:hypothetical protein